MTWAPLGFRGRAIHLVSTQDARAVCGIDWMALRLKAVSWQQRDKATCRRCIAKSAALIRGVK